MPIPNGTERNKNMRKATTTIYHPNARGTGCAMRLSLQPAEGPISGYLKIQLAPQLTIGERNDDPVLTKYPTFDWDRDLKACMSINDLAHLLEVFRGCEESINDGKGLYYTDEDYAYVFRMSHIIEPAAGYLIKMNKSDKRTGDVVTARIALSPTEALGMMTLIESVLVLIAFGESEFTIG